MNPFHIHHLPDDENFHAGFTDQIGFSSDGNLLQVDRAKKATSSGPTVLGLATDKGVVLATKKSSRLLENTTNQQHFHKLDDRVVAVYTGMTGDGRRLINDLRVFLMHYRFEFGINISIKMLADHLGHLMHEATMTGGTRPFGVDVLIAGYTEEEGYCLYRVDPSGLAVKWHAVAIGSNSQPLNSYLEGNYSQDRDGVALIKSMPNLGETNMAILTKDGLKDIE